MERTSPPICNVQRSGREGKINNRTVVIDCFCFSYVSLINWHLSVYYVFLWWDCVEVRNWGLKLFYNVLHQGFYQLLEPKVTIRCRKLDVQLVQVSEVSEFRLVGVNIGKIGENQSVSWPLLTSKPVYTEPCQLQGLGSFSSAQITVTAQWIKMNHIKTKIAVKSSSVALLLLVGTS